MEITTGNPSLLQQKDILKPFVATIADVRIETLTDKRGNQDEQYVVYFTTGRPMKFNVINRKTVVEAYGKQREGWIGKPIEIYVDPNVMMGSERTGGIRVRIPIAPAAPIGARPGSPPGPKPPPKPVTAPKPPPPLAPSRPAPPPPLGAKHAQVLAGLDRATTADNANEWASYGRQFAFTEEQHAEQQRHHHDAMERTALSAEPAGRRPAPARA